MYREAKWFCLLDTTQYIIFLNSFGVREPEEYRSAPGGQTSDSVTVVA